jgi:hypothetical protein
VVLVEQGEVEKAMEREKQDIDVLAMGQFLELHGQIDSALSPVSWLLIRSLALGCSVLVSTLALPKFHALRCCYFDDSTEPLLRLHLQLALLIAAGS